MNQAPFIEHLAAKMGVTYTEAESFVRTFKSLTCELLAAGDTVQLSGFGQFSVSHRKARLGHNPRTALPMTIEELNTPKFKAGQAFKQAVALKK